MQKELLSNSKCQKIGEHRFFCVETGAVIAEGKVFVISVCTSCGEGNFQAFSVASPNQEIALKSDNKGA